MAKRERQHPDAGPGLFDGAQEARPERPAERPAAPAPRGGPAEAAPAPRTSPPRRAAAAGPARADAPDEGPRVLSVGELTGAVRERLEALGRLQVEGELSGMKRAASGHVYFDLKDATARISCVVWRSKVDSALRFEPEEGMAVVASGRLDVYAPRGSYSLIVERLEPRGIGALLARFEELKRELSSKGWFDRRRPLPRYPRCVGVVTSTSGAALRDVLRTRSLRWPAYPMRLAHAPVQGPGAAPEIAAAIERLDRSGVDVIVVCRGGGSLEDLWAFNERPVAEAIWNASVPVVSGVGHETDTTLADLVADHRAHTPTDAAQTVLPDRAALTAELARQANHLAGAMDGFVEERAERLAGLARRPVMRDAGWILTRRSEALSALGRRQRLALRARLREADAGLRRLLHRLERQSPRARLEGWERALASLGGRLLGLGSRSLERGEGRLGLAARSLQAVSPLAVLGRGYSLTTRRGEAAPLVGAGELAAGDELETRLASAEHVVSRVVEVRPPAAADVLDAGPDEPRGDPS